MDEQIQPDEQTPEAPAAEPVQSEIVTGPEVTAEQGGGVEVMDDDSDSAKQFSWQASEFIHHQKKATWYIIFVVAVIVLVAIAAVTHQWFSVAVFIAMAAALLVYANKEPRILQYQLDGTGITIERKHYPYSQFHSYAVFNDVAWHAIDLDPTQRFLPRLTVLFESKDLDAITGLLDQHIPRLDRTPDLVERITRNLKF